MAFEGYLRQSTAVDVLIGPFIDDTDGKTAEIGLAPDVELSKNGQALANKSDVTVPTHDAAGDVDGYYNCELDATDTDTLGILKLVVHEAGALPVTHTYQVVKANWYDTMCSTDYLQTDVIQVEGGDATDAITAAATASLNTYDPPTNAEMEARTILAADYFDPVNDAVANVTLCATTTTNTDMRGTDNAALAATALTNATWTDARAGYLDELAAANLPTDIADIPTVAEFNARTLLAADYFDPAADAVANVTLCATTTTNTDMRGTDNAALAATALTNATWTDARAGYLDELAAANLPTDIADIPTVAEFEARTLLAADYFDPALDTVANVTLVATTTTNTDMRGTDNAALATTALTNATWTDARAGYIDELAAANLPADIAALNDLSAADVNAQVVDVLRTDTIPDSINADGSAPTIAQAIYGIYQFLTERSVSSTTVTVKKVDGSTGLMTLTLDSATAPTSITRAT